MTAIATEDLAKTFRRRWTGEEFHAVDGISLRVERGATYGLLGPNGAGKTTFVKLLLSCARPTRGSARIFGRDSREAEARRSVGYLPENHRFPTYMTGAGMLDFYGALSGMDAARRRRRIPELLETVGLEKWGGVRLGKYSKGMLQRVGLAQALLHSPSLLILDEPSDGVDPIGRRRIRDILHRLNEDGVTVFLNSHLLSEVELFCREAAIIHKGKVALEGTMKELTAGSGYKLTVENPPEALRDALRAEAKAAAARDHLVEFLFATREDANRAVDLLRSAGCDIESLARVNSTLEEVFVRTVNTV